MELKGKQRNEKMDTILEWADAFAKSCAFTAYDKACLIDINFNGIRYSILEDDVPLIFELYGLLGIKQS